MGMLGLPLPDIGGMDGMMPNDPGHLKVINEAGF